MDFDTRRDCHEPGRLQRLGEASGIFFTGGNQLRLTTLLGGTPVAKLVRLRNAAGVALCEMVSPIIVRRRAGAAAE